ncbi:peptidase G1 [Boletus reticuloceps]|uniref:Peptidase G1 n=1 Tax=Boletus reticuloceps TaxID=495285 RepID=A0A8I2YZT6_9AGAM|nr:peptidase G1 [Boletus reticuloceps]
MKLVVAMFQGTFHTVTGTFSVPNISGQRVNSSASAVVGIDGGTCADVMLLAGVLFTVTTTGPRYKAWYGWGLNSISPGHVIKLTVGTWGETSGLAAVQNLNNNQSALRYFNSQRALCGQNAVWIVEDHAKDFGLPLANFGTVTFLEAKADAKNGQTYLPQGATITEIVELGGQPMTSVSVNKDMVNIKYLY